MKAKETIEEKRIRRLAKKLAKEEKAKQEMGWQEKQLGYSNTENPFNDPNLTEVFIWKAKYEKQGVKVTPKVEEKLKKERAEESKVKKCVLTYLNGILKVKVNF